MTKEVRSYSGGKTVSSVNDAGKTEQLLIYAKKNEIRKLFNTIWKNKGKMNKI